MKVTEIKQYRVQDPRGRGGYYVIKVNTDAGISGLGEVGIRGWGNAIQNAIDHLAELVVGSDPWETERLWQEMFRSGFFPADTVYSCAISAIDIALWDIKGKSVDKPVYKLLGGPVRDKVICYPHIGGATIEKLVDSAKEHWDKGWKFARWHQPPTHGDLTEPGVLDPRDGIKVSAQAMEAVRKALPDIQICFDLHTRIDTTHAIEMCRELEPYKPFFIEDPIRSENAASYKKVYEKVNLPIAAGEQWGSKWGFREVIENEWIVYARIDLCIVGGITEALKITHWAETHYIDIVPHNPLGPVSAAACVALCMASSNVGVQEMPRQPGTFATDLFPQQIEWAEGYAWSPDMPGLGVELDEKVAEANAITDSKTFTPRMTRSDGAFTNW